MIGNAKTNTERIALIAGYPIAKIYSAPGHRNLRDPDAVAKMAAAMRAGEFDGVTDEFILLGVFTRNGIVRVIECLDGHHRLLAALNAGLWRTIGDIPKGVVDTRVDGVRAGDTKCEARWIPKSAAEASAIPEEERPPVPVDWGAKGETVMISGAICGADDIFEESVRSVPLSALLRELH